jgi:hypothetical protein
VTVATGATLAGDAMISGPVTIAGDLDPGLTGQTWPSTLVTGPATLSGNYRCQLDDQRSDTLEVIGDLDLTGSILTLETTFDFTSPPTFTIATYTGELNGAFTSVSGMPRGYQLEYRAAQKQIVLTRMTYADWTAGFLSLADTTPDGDPDGDGIPNLLECVLGGNPAAKDLPAILPTQTLDENNLVFHYKRNDASAYGTVQTVQWSPDLVTWIDIPITLWGSGYAQITQNGEAPDDISLSIPRYSDKMFVRLKVTLP